MQLDENDPEGKRRYSAFTQALADLGWTDGRNARIDLRWAGGDIKERVHGLALRFQPEAGLALLVGRNPKIGDELPEMGRHGSPSRQAPVFFPTEGLCSSKRATLILSTLIGAAVAEGEAALWRATAEVQQLLGREIWREHARRGAAMGRFSGDHYRALRLLGSMAAASALWSGTGLRSRRWSTAASGRGDRVAGVGLGPM
jgi:hypothetical protein